MEKERNEKLFESIECVESHPSVDYVREHQKQWLADTGRRSRVECGSSLDVEAALAREVLRYAKHVEANWTNRQQVHNLVRQTNKKRKKLETNTQ